MGCWCFWPDRSNRTYWPNWYGGNHCRWSNHNQPGGWSGICCKYRHLQCCGICVYYSHWPHGTDWSYGHCGPSGTYWSSWRYRSHWTYRPHRFSRTYWPSWPHWTRWRTWTYRTYRTYWFRLHRHDIRVIGGDWYGLKVIHDQRGLNRYGVCCWPIHPHFQHRVASQLHGRHCYDV